MCIATAIWLWPGVQAASLSASASRPDFAIIRFVRYLAGTRTCVAVNVLIVLLLRAQVFDVRQAERIDGFAGCVMRGLPPNSTVSFMPSKLCLQRHLHTFPVSLASSTKSSHGGQKPVQPVWLESRQEIQHRIGHLDRGHQTGSDESSGCLLYKVLSVGVPGTSWLAMITYIR